MIYRLILLMLILTNLFELKSQSFEWAKKLGGPGSDKGESIAIDASGNVYTTGTFSATADFDPGSGNYNITASNYDVFISKLDQNGDFVWAKKLGGTSSDVGYSIIVDNNGNVIVLGHFNGTVDFDPGVSIYNLTSAGSDDVFICKLDSSGDFVWARHFGGASYDVGYALATDNSGNVYTTGFFSNTADFDPGVGIYNLSASGLNEEIFVSKLDINGNFIWAKRMGGFYDDNALDISVDNQGNVYTIGKFYQTADFDPSTSTYNLTSNGNYDVFISKLDSSGSFVWAKSIGGSGNDQGQSISMDGLGNILLTGVFYGIVDFDPGIGVTNLTSLGGSDVFVAKLNPAGNLIWAKNVGGSANDVGFSIASDNVGNSYLTGYFQGTSDFNPGNGIFNLSSSGNGDIFILKLKSNGSFDWAKSLGGSSALVDLGNSIALDAIGNAFITGEFYGTGDFNFGSGTFDVTSNGNDDAFVLKIGVCSSPLNSADSVLVCDSFAPPSGKTIWTNSGVYFDTISSFFGCDSIVEYHLTVNYSDDTSISQVSCNSFISPSGKYVWTSSGNYSDTLTNYNGCDSVINVNLTINNSNSSSLSEVVCNTYTSPSGNHVWTNSGIYSDTMSNYNGCDSIISINLTVNYTNLSNITEMACNNYTSPSGKQTWTQSGVYLDTVMNVQGCDSIITINLAINKSSSSNTSINACNFYTSPSGKYLWTSDGLFQDTIPNSFGCDSVLTISLKITNLDTAIQLNGHTLLSIDSFATHQWIECSSNNIISGAVNSSYKPQSNGIYKVALMRNDCADTSKCIEIKTIGIPFQDPDKDFILQPNPTYGQFWIKYPIKYGEISYQIADITGKIIEKGIGNNNINLDIKGKAGVYLVNLKSVSGESQVVRIIKID